jgi:hypothetical protein
MRTVGERDAGRRSLLLESPRETAPREVAKSDVCKAELDARLGSVSRNARSWRQQVELLSTALRLHHRLVDPG